MNILLIGSGGREHALAWKLAQSPRADRVFVAPGNAGTDIDGENVPILSTDFPKLIKFAKENNVGLTVVGPEAPLADGIVDAFEQAGLRIFGPRKSAAELEGSKVFCKDLLRNADVPSADYQTFTKTDDAIKFLRDREDMPVVVKADGLAAGKGVFVCANRSEALDAVDKIAGQKIFGAAGNRLVIEERLDGQEASVLAITDGRTIVTLPAAQDHKPAYDGDTGPNTGGMGAYCPAPLITPDMLHEIEEHILVPTVHTMKRSRKPFKGVLYAGLMITKQGPKVLEYNVRFGDPECQPLLMRLENRPARRAGGDRRWAARSIAALGMGSASGGMRGDGQPRISGRIRERPSDPRPGRRRGTARRKSLSLRNGCERRSDRHRRRPRSERHRPGLDNCPSKAQRLPRRKMHPLAGALVQKRYFG